MDAERLEDSGRAGVVAGVRGQTEQVVGVDGVGALVLGDVGAQLVEQTDASPLVAGCVDQHAALLGGDDAQALAQLDAAVAAQ